MQTIGGIRQTAAGWKKISFQPAFIGDHGGTVVPSPLGPIRSEWKRQGNSVTVKLALPKGVSARVQLPERSPETVTGLSRWKVPAPDVSL
jgi:hypothetical protein